MFGSFVFVLKKTNWILRSSRSMTKKLTISFHDLEAVSQYEKDLFCHSEFISESHNFSMLQTPEILKRVQDDNCDTASCSGNPEGLSFI